MTPNEVFGAVLFAHTWVSEDQRSDKYQLRIGNRFPGFFGLVMPSVVAKGFADYAYNFFWDAPVDWLYGGYMATTQRPFYTVKYAIFEHVGASSTKSHVLEFEHKANMGQTERLNMLRWADCATIPLHPGITYGIGVITASSNISISFRGSIYESVRTFLTKIQKDVDKMVNLQTQVF